MGRGGAQVSPGWLRWAPGSFTQPLAVSSARPPPPPLLLGLNASAPPSGAPRPPRDLPPGPARRPPPPRPAPNAGRPAHRKKLRARRFSNRPISGERRASESLAGTCGQWWAVWVVWVVWAAPTAAAARHQQACAGLAWSSAVGPSRFALWRHANGHAAPAHATSRPLSCHQHVIYAGPAAPCYLSCNAPCTATPPHPHPTLWILPF